VQSLREQLQGRGSLHLHTDCASSVLSCRNHPQTLIIPKPWEPPKEPRPKARQSMTYSMVDFWWIRGTSLIKRCCLRSLANPCLGAPQCDCSQISPGNISMTLTHQVLACHSAVMRSTARLEAVAGSIADWRYQSSVGARSEYPPCCACQAWRHGRLVHVGTPEPGKGPHVPRFRRQRLVHGAAAHRVKVLRQACQTC
jgi:hypothetical protein